MPFLHQQQPVGGVLLCTCPSTGAAGEGDWCWMDPGGLTGSPWAGVTMPPLPWLQGEELQSTQ